MQTKLDGLETSFFSPDRSIVSRRREGGVAGFALSLQGLPPSRPHMNSLQRTWIFQGIDVQMHSDAGWDPGSVKDLLWCLSEALLFNSEACRDRGCCRNALLALKQQCSSKTHEMWARFWESSRFHFSSLGYFGSFWFVACSGAEVALLHSSLSCFCGLAVTGQDIEFIKTWKPLHLALRCSSLALLQQASHLHMLKDLESHRPTLKERPSGETLRYNS